MIEENKKKIKITDIELLIAVAFIVDIVCFAYQYMNVEYRVYSHWENIATTSRNNFITSGLVLVMMLCFFAAAVLSLIEKKRLNSAIMCVLILIIFGTFWTVLAMRGDSIVTIVKSPVSPFVLIMSVLVFVGYNERAWEITKKLVFISSIAYTFMSIFEIIRFIINFGLETRLMLSGALYGIIVVIFFMYFTLLFNDGLLKKYKLLISIQIFLIISVTLVLQSRSWVVHSLLLMVIFIFKLSTHYKNKTVYYLIVSLVGIVVLTLASSYLITISGGLLDRMTDDSRTGQLEMFFSQVSFKDLMLGGGMRAGYSCFGDSNYQFIDNLVIQTMFKYGIIPTVAYLTMIFVPLIYGFKHKESEARKGIFFFVPWILIMLGFAIFVSYSNNIYNYLIYFVIGRLSFLREKDRKARALGQLTLN